MFIFYSCPYLGFISKRKILENTSRVLVFNYFSIVLGAHVKFLNIFKAKILELINSAFVLKIEKTLVINIGVSKIYANYYKYY